MSTGGQYFSIVKEDGKSPLKPLSSFTHISTSSNCSWVANCNPCPNTFVNVNVKMPNSKNSFFEFINFYLGFNYLHLPNNI